MKTANRGHKGLKMLAVITAVSIAILGFLGASRFGGQVDASASGPSPSRTNAPGEGNCTACHSEFPLNSGTGGVTISAPPANYKPGQQIPITVTTSQSDALIYGFQLTGIDHTGKTVGTFSFPNQMPPPIQEVFGLVEGDLRNYIEHTSDGIVPTQFGSKSWTFTWTAPPLRAGKIGFYAAGNAANGDGNTSGDYIYTTSGYTLAGSSLSNFDSDALNDVALWRPSNGVWYSINSADHVVQETPWGLGTDKMVPGDYDGDGKTDIAVWRPETGTWYIRNSSGGSTVATWGVAGDVPVPGDYDGDLKYDLAVWRQSTGFWYIYRSSDGGVTFAQWGSPTDLPVQADYDGDAKTDIGVYRESNGVWYLYLTGGAGVVAAQWGIPNSKPVPGDYDGDGKCDLAVFLPANGTWYLYNSSNATFNSVQWGVATDVPVTADFDGDGLADITVFRDGVWLTFRSTDGGNSVVSWGTTGDIPVPNAYQPN